MIVLTALLVGCGSSHSDPSLEGSWTLSLSQCGATYTCPGSITLSGSNDQLTGEIKVAQDSDCYPLLGGTANLKAALSTLSGYVDRVDGTRGTVYGGTYEANWMEFSVGIEPDPASHCAGYYFATR